MTPAHAGLHFVIRALGGLVLGGMLVACAPEPAPLLVTEPLPDLPEPVSNNAVALAGPDEAPVVVSLMGLAAGKTWRDVHARAYLFGGEEPGWTRLPNVPGPGGRLAGTAIGLRDAVILFGGYTVAEDDSEVSVARVQRLDLATRTWTELAPMPVPVDDSVSLGYGDRYIYLVSGWHDSGNVNLVQVYDLVEDRWFQATPWPGPPLFGHAGGIVGETLVVCDGVGIESRLNERRRFVAIAACYIGRIDPENPSRIDWRRLPHHGGPPLYRMAATGSAARGEVVFVGGSDNPYNYDGVGYDGKPSEPSARMFAWNLETETWRELGRLPEPTMDHRGLLALDDGFVVVGGMRAGQAVSPGQFRIRPAD